jgi:hypothetical protein
MPPPANVLNSSSHIIRLLLMLFVTWPTEKVRFMGRTMESIQQDLVEESKIDATITANSRAKTWK